MYTCGCCGENVEISDGTVEPCGNCLETAHYFGNPIIKKDLIGICKLCLDAMSKLPQQEALDDIHRYINLALAKLADI